MRAGFPGARHSLALLGLLLLAAAAAPARAQDDGARLYMLVPEGTTIASVRLHRLHSNLAVDPGNVAEQGSLDTFLEVFQFVQALVGRARGRPHRDAARTLALIRGGRCAQGRRARASRASRRSRRPSAPRISFRCAIRCRSRASPSSSRSTTRARAVAIEVTAETVARTGVEMEALTAAAVGLLTIYDMCKAVDRGMRIEGVRLLEKSGGKSGHFVADVAGMALTLVRWLDHLTIAPARA